MRGRNPKHDVIWKSKNVKKCHRKKSKTIILNLNVDQLNKMKINGLECLNN